MLMAQLDSDFTLADTESDEVYLIIILYRTMNGIHKLYYLY